MQHPFYKALYEPKIPPRSICVHSILKQIKKQLSYDSTKNIVITDFRFIHEYQLVLESYPDMKFFLVSKNNLSILNQSNNWEYEINEILSNIVNTNSNNFNIIKNTSTLDSLYNNINTILQSNKYLLQKYNIIDNNNIKHMHFC